MENVRSIMSEIKDSLDDNKSYGSRKDEIAVFKAMLNDPDYSVGIYTKNGKVGDYCPYEDCRKMLSNIITATTKISLQESKELAYNYEITKQDATSFINISKEFINTYLQTGRKLPLGGRQNIDAKLVLDHVKDRDKVVPYDGGNGKKVFRVPAHDVIRTNCPCPEWIK